MNKFVKICARILFVIYLLVLILVLVLKFPTGMLSGTFQSLLAGEPVQRMEPQLVPFKTIIEYCGYAQAVYDWFVKNLACNLIMFMPYGFLLPIFMKPRKHPAFFVIASGCLLSVAIEIFQYFSALGVCDIDDVILNTVSVALGYGIYKLVRLLIKKQ